MGQFSVEKPVLPGSTLSGNQQQSHIVPAGGVRKTSPGAGELVNKGSRIDIQISTGPAKSWYSNPTVLVAGTVLILLGAIIAGLFTSNFLVSLSDERGARGLITFLIAVVTVGIALVVVLANIITDGDDADKQFDRGKQVLSIMIGMLGTIVGFYFGSAAVAPQTTQQGAGHQITFINPLPDGKVGTDYPATTIIQATGGTPPLKWSLNPALPADLGLTLDSATGVISGKPTKPSPKTKYTAAVADSATPANSSTAEITLEIKQ